MFDPVPVQWLSERAVKRQPLGQGEYQQLWKEEQVPLPHLAGRGCALERSLKL